MAKQFYTNGTGSQQTLTPSQNEKVAVYQTIADAEADLANLEEGQIVATPDTGDENAQPVDVVESGNMHAVTSNAVANSNAMPVDVVALNNVHSVTSNAVAQAFGTWETLLNVTGAIVMGLVQNGVKYLYFHFEGYTVTSSGDRLFTLPSNFRTTQQAQRFYFFYDYPDTKFSFGNILSNGQVLLYGAGNFGNTEIYGDYFLLLL